ncbi:hypothetical protein AYO20_05344 [Fonsecaea nubica]|uniref:Xylanolytic transcriptional activator regulatory domain-containing protein n=1 Tax=Fonsecaea nubica TaxID=856822 RepID=A0A178D1M9_9EURO|nr:hypothetical protein AYO20_05344 [Fonsecaea nubica]OAL35293.1 hypothetical protein AYO20_05344 [Fonsecaea nubica]
MEVLAPLAREQGLNAVLSSFLPQHAQPLLAPKTSFGQDSTSNERLDEVVGPLSAESHTRSPVSSQHLPTAKGQPDENLSRFFDHAVVSSDWHLFDQNGVMRIAYIGTDTANMNNLMRTHEMRVHDTHRPQYLHYPIPSFHSPLPWKPTADLLIRDSLVETYFTEIHPGIPIIDEADFRRRYADPENPPPLLLFHAVLLAAARVSDCPMLVRSRATATATLYRRARALFNLRYENDRLLLVQSSMLMAWHTENSDTVGCNGYYWIGNAVRVALGLGMHRKAATIYLPTYERRTHRVFHKVWWLLVYAEVFLALEYGRPCMIRRQDFDVDGLEEADFMNTDDSDDMLVNREFCCTTSELCLLALDILDLHAPLSRTRDDEAAIIEID